MAAPPRLGRVGLVSRLVLPTIDFIPAPAPGYDRTQSFLCDGCPARNKRRRR
jgi:hypothetical protein